VAPDGWNLSGDDKLFQQNLDHLLTLASEEYDNEPERTDEDDVDKIFAVASQQFESTSASNERFEKPTSSADLIRSGIPDKTQKTTSWALRVWREWAVYRRDNRLDEDEKHVELLEEFVLMQESDQAFWLCRFVCEVKRRYKKPYPPNTIYQLVCALMRGLNWKWRDEGKPDVNFFENLKYCLMKATLDSRMKQLHGTGAFQPRQAEVISPDYEDLLWKERLLGDHSPQVLVDMLVFYFGMYFALRSGQDHRRLRHHPSQIQLLDPCGGTPYLRYQEDVSKTNQGGLQHRKCQKKEVIHYANEENSEHYIVCLYNCINLYAL